MINFNVEGLDQLAGLTEGTLESFLATFGVLAAFFIILLAILIIFLWVFGSIGLMNLAKQNNISNPWLAFIPVGRSYIVGKLGFEVYGKDNKNNTTFMWITLGLGAASFVLSNSSGDLHQLISYGLLFFESWAFYNMFKALKPKNSIVYTVFTVLTDTILGGLFIYLIKPEEANKGQTATEEEVKETKKEEKKEKETSKGNFCQYCGSKLASDAKFCPECGKKVK